MIRHPLFFLLACSALQLSTSWAFEDKLPLEIKVNTRSDKDSERFKDAKLGKGKKFTTVYSFVINAENTGTETLENLSFRLIPFANNNEWSQRKEKMTFYPRTPLKAGPLALESWKREEIPIGSATYISTESKTSDTLWKSGYEYTGFVLEIYKGKELVDYQVEGKAKTFITDAYANFQKDGKVIP